MIEKNILRYILICIGFFWMWSAAIGPAHAVISSCSATVSPTTVSTSTSQAFTFTMGSVSGVLWIRVTRPSANFTINSASGGGWNSQVSESTATFTPVGQTAGDATVTVTATSGSSEAASANWTVQVSDDGGGASPTTCTGSLGTAISGAGADTTAPAISDIVVSDVADTSVRITWTTNESSNTVVDYGTSTDYGSTATGDSSVTSHSVTISSLSANTTYHYNVKSTDAASNTAESGDNTFVTAKAGTTTTTTTTGTVTTTAKATPTPVPDRSPPSAAVSTDLTKPFTAAPTIEGKASDASGVSSVEYSTDDGKNWLPVDTLKTVGGRSVTFSFLPLGLEDDTYSVKLRATDSKGNVGAGKAVSMVIDRLPPRIGASVVSLGPELLTSRGQNLLVTIAGLRPKIYLSAVGGPTKIDLTETAIATAAAFSQTLPLLKNPENGLWSAELVFPAPGVYTLGTYAIDGAQNEATRALQTVVALAPGSAVDSAGRPVSGATITVYTFDATTARYVVWDGPSYGQANPQTTGPDGNYQLFLPTGTYYIEVKAKGHRKLKTQIFGIRDPLPITSNLPLPAGRRIRIGPWEVPLPDFGASFQMISTEPPHVELPVSQPIVGRELPYVTFPVEGKNFVSTDIRGKPTVLTALNTWWPQAGMQLQRLEELSAHKEINVLVLVPQESPSQVEIFRRRGGYSVPMVADKDGDLVDPLQYQLMPTHYFVNRKGVIGKVITGMAGERELLDNLVQ